MKSVTTMVILVMLFLEHCGKGRRIVRAQNWKVAVSSTEGSNTTLKKGEVLYKRAESPTEFFGPIQISPGALPHSLPPEASSPPLYPYFPTNPEPVFTGRCPVNFSAITIIAEKTAGDCTAPLATYLGNVICCPQFHSMIRIFQGEYSSVSGSLVLNKTVAEDCFKDITSILVSSGANGTIPDLCSINAYNLTGGSCPVRGTVGFERVVNTTKLRNACTNIDPLRECCRPTCQPVINEAAVQLASRDSSLSSNNKFTASLPQERIVDDCKGVVLAWLSKQLDFNAANTAFRILFSCKVNKGMFCRRCCAPSLVLLLVCLFLFAMVSGEWFVLDGHVAVHHFVIC